MVKRRKSGFANARVEQLLRNVGAHRVSADAVYRFNQILTDKSLPNLQLRLLEIQVEKLLKKTIYGWQQIDKS